MDNQDGAIRTIIEQHFEASAVSILEPWGLALDGTIANAVACDKNIVGDSVLSVLSATGKGIKILSSLNANFGTLSSLYPYGQGASIDELRDWCGELNNQMVGAAKNHLLAYQCQLTMGLPTLIQGENLASINANEAVVTKRHFVAESGTIIAYLSTVIDPQFTMADQADVALTGLKSGGELDFF